MSNNGGKSVRKIRITEFWGIMVNGRKAFQGRWIKKSLFPLSKPPTGILIGHSNIQLQRIWIALISNIWPSIMMAGVKAIKRNQSCYWILRSTEDHCWATLTKNFRTCENWKSVWTGAEIVLALLHVYFHKTCVEKNKTLLSL